MLRRRLGVIAFVLLAFGSLLASNLLIVAKTQAAPDPPTNSSVAAFLDRAHISLSTSGTGPANADMSKTTGVYYDKNIADGDHTYRQGGDKKVGTSNGCASWFTIGNIEQTQITGTLHVSAPTAGTAAQTKCTDGSKNTVDIAITNAQVTGEKVWLFSQVDGPGGSKNHQPGLTSDIMFFKQDANTIYQADDDPSYDNDGNKILVLRTNPGTNGPFQFDDGSGSTTAYFNQGYNDTFCPPLLAHADDGSPSLATFYTGSQSDGKTCTNKSFASNYKFLVLGSRPDTGVPGAAGETKTDGTDDLCTIPTWGLRWVACPLLTATQEGIQAMDKVLQTLLIVNASETFDTSKPTGQAYYAGFRAFQGIALSILVIVTLIMVAGQALGFELLDAYTVRKVLPRLVAMVVILVILWPGLRFIVGFFDNMTNWTGDIIAAPFRALGPETKTGFTEIATQYIAGAAGYLAFGIIGLLSLAATLFLSVLTLVVILLARKLIILICIVTSPVAVVCSILPNTRKVATIWKDGFIPAEVAGMAIAATEGAGIAAAHVATAANTGGVGGTVAVIIVVVTQGLLIVVIRGLGGTIATVTGMANDRSRGLNDRMRNFRGNRMKERGSAMARGDLYQGTNRVARAFNATTAGATNVAKTSTKAGINPRGWTPSALNRKYQQTKDQQISQGAAAIMQSQGFKEISQNDDALMAAGYNSEGEAVRALTQRFGGDEARARNAVAAAQAGGQKIGTNAFKVAAAMQRVSTGTGYTTHTITNPDGTTREVSAMEDMTSTLAAASGGNAALATRMAGFANAETKKVGRNDLAPGFGRVNELVQDQVGGGRVAAGRFNAATVEAARGTDNATLMRNKPEAVTNVARALDISLQNGQAAYAAATTDAERAAANAVISEASAKLKNMSDSGLYAPEVNLQPLAPVTTTRTVGPAGQRTGEGRAVEATVATATQRAQAGGADLREQQLSEVYNRDRPSRMGFNPNDPNNPNAGT